MVRIYVLAKILILTNIIGLYSLQFDVVVFIVIGFVVSNFSIDDINSSVDNIDVHLVLILTDFLTHLRLLAICHRTTNTRFFRFSISSFFDVFLFFISLANFPFFTPFFYFQFGYLVKFIMFSIHHCLSFFIILLFIFLYLFISFFCEM